MRAVGKNLDRGERKTMARAVSKTPNRLDRGRLGRGPGDLFPILLRHHQPQDRTGAIGLNLIPSFTLESYQGGPVAERLRFKPFMNSVILSIGSTVLALVVAIPAAWAMAFAPQTDQGHPDVDAVHQDDAAVAVLVPIYLIFPRPG